MTQWIIARGEPSPEIDPEVLEEGALAMAQATIQNAIDQAGINRADLARQMGRPRSFITRMLAGQHNLTVRTFARAMAACGFELEFRYAPIRWGWVTETARVESAQEDDRISDSIRLGGVPAPQPVSSGDAVQPAA
jgi:hypothetical protein